jgi:hypothetical protein
MTVTSPALQHELNALVREQIQLFKQPAILSDTEILEYHLRYLQIMVLYRELDRIRSGYLGAN